MNRSHAISFLVLDQLMIPLAMGSFANSAGDYASKPLEYPLVYFLL